MVGRIARATLVLYLHCCDATYELAAALFNVQAKTANQCSRADATRPPRLQAHVRNVFENEENFKKLCYSKAPPQITIAVHSIRVNSMREHCCIATEKCYTVLDYCRTQRHLDVQSTITRQPRIPSYPQATETGTPANATQNGLPLFYTRTLARQAKEVTRLSKSNGDKYKNQNAHDNSATVTLLLSKVHTVQELTVFA